MKINKELGEGNKPLQASHNTNVFITQFPKKHMYGYKSSRQNI